MVSSMSRSGKDWVRCEEWRTTCNQNVGTRNAPGEPEAVRPWTRSGWWMSDAQSVQGIRLTCRNCELRLDELEPDRWPFREQPGLPPQSCSMQSDGQSPCGLTQQFVFALIPALYLTTIPAYWSFVF